MAQFLHCAFEHLAIQIESNRFDVTVLLAAKQVSRSAKLQVQGGDPEASAQLAEFPDGGQALRC